MVYEIWIPIKYKAMRDNYTLNYEKKGEPYEDSDSDYQKAMEFRTYQNELRNDMALHATQFIIISSYDKIAMFLWTVHRSFTGKSWKEKTAKFFTHPILTLPYMVVILYLEKCTSILQNLWIMYMMFIFIRNVCSSIVCIALLFYIPFVVPAMLFWYSPISLISWMNLFFGMLMNVVE